MPHLTNKIVILVDDGLASGFTMLAAARSVKGEQTYKNNHCRAHGFLRRYRAACARGR